MWQNWHPSVVSTVAESSTVVITSTVRWAIIFGIGLIVGVATLGAGIKGDGGVPGIIRTLAGLLVLACVIGLMIVGIRRAIVGPDKVEAPVTQTTQTSVQTIQATPPAPSMPAPPTASRTVKAQPAKATTTSAKPEMTVAEKKAAWCPNPRSKVLKDWCATH